MILIFFKISKYEPGTEAEVLPELIRLPGSFHFFSSLQLILMWPIEEILLLCQIFPSFSYIQLLLFTRFKDLSPHDLWDIVGYSSFLFFFEESLFLLFLFRSSFLFFVSFTYFLDWLIQLLK